MARYQRKDSWHQRAKREGLPSRAAYKLAEIQRAQRLLKPGARVADLGCWPGGWLAVAARAVMPGGRVVGVDLRALDAAAMALPGVVALQGDFADAAVVQRLLGCLGAPADVLLCDAAPQLTGVRAADRANEAALLEALAAALPPLLRPGGALLAKQLDCPEAAEFAAQLRRSFATLKLLRPQATRPGSSERYVLARGYGGSGGRRETFVNAALAPH